MIETLTNVVLIVTGFQLLLVAGVLITRLPNGIRRNLQAVLRRRLRRDDAYSSPDSLDLGWVVGLLLVISLHWFFVSSRSVLALLDVEVGGLTSILDLFSISIFLVFTTVLVVRGKAHVKAFPEIEESVGAHDQKLSRDELQECSRRLRACMRFEKPHLDPSLGVDDLAIRLKTPTWQLSRVLNGEFGQNFFNFINTYRVEEAKRQLEDPGKNHVTMLQVLHEAGFNSKSTFNDAFKRHTGMTPSEYRRRTQQPVAHRELATLR